MEEEVRQILKNTVNSPERLGDFAVECFGEKNGIDLTPPKYNPHEPIKFT